VENTQDQERRTMSDDNTRDDAEPSPVSAGSRPFPKVSPKRLLEILRMNCESGDILCGDAADEIERLRLTDEERQVIEWCIFQQSVPQRKAVTLRALLSRTG
jgi:hypothetical protein